MRGSVLAALDAWSRASAVCEPAETSCGIWECCLFYKPVAETRDTIEELLRTTPLGPARELRQLVQDADARIAGETSGFWWRDPLRWRS